MLYDTNIIDVAVGILFAIAIGISILAFVLDLASPKFTRKHRKSKKNSGHL